MTQTLVVVGGLFLLIYVPLGVLAWRRPLLARFAWREATRRRGQFALLVVGLMVGSASITASLIAGDSADQTLAYALSQRLGAVDLTVTGPGGSSFPAEVASKLAMDPTLRPYVDGVQGGVELPASVSDLDQRLGKSGSWSVSIREHNVVSARTCLQTVGGCTANSWLAATSCFRATSRARWMPKSAIAFASTREREAAAPI